jgi:arylsulfatase A-like enzyme
MVAFAAAAALVAGSLATPSARQRPERDDRPNILFIISDDHRWDGLGAAGNRHVVTPNLDRLAAEGVHFTQATIHVPQCSPLRAQLLTGLSPHQTGWYSNQAQRAQVQSPHGFDRFPRLPDLLQRAGYRTVLIGKWHLLPDPWLVGFTDVRTWLPGGGGPYRDIPLAQGNSRETRAADGFTQEVFANRAIDFLKSDEAQQAPFLLWLAFTAPHGPHRPNPPHIEKLYAGKRDEEIVPPGFTGTGRTRRWVAYYEAISFLDEQVGRVLETLEARRLAERTVVVFLGDNGFMMGSRDWDGKVLPYEDSIRVPLIVRAPAIAKLKGQTDAAASSLDVPPTLARLAGVAPPRAWAGRDLRPVLAGTRNHGITHAVSEFADTTSEQFGRHAYRLARTPSHKLILWNDRTRGDELYDLKQDPRESTNALGQPQVEQVEATLRKVLDDWMKRTADPFRQAAAPTIRELP